MMIVPFLLGVEEDPIHYLWIFYKYIDFSLKYKCPIIAQEAYFEKTETLKNKKPFVFKDIRNGYNEVYEFKEPTDRRIKKLKKQIITKEEENLAFARYSNKHEAFVDLLKKRNKELEKIIEDKIIAIEISEQKKIKILLTWIWFPSLEYVAKRHDIIVITQEQTTYRKPVYNTYMGYCCIGNKYNAKFVRDEYNKFKDEKTYKIFSRDELLVLFLSTNNLKYLKESKKCPKYEFGIDLGMDKDAPNEAFSQFTNNYKIQKCKKLVGKDKICARTHPMRPSKVKYEIMDNSINSIEWILKCRRIVSTVSNLGFEAMLFGKTSYILGDNMPFCTQTINTLDYIDDYICETKFLNYITFGYFAPFGLMYNKEYLMWRTNNSIKKIYEYNISYILEKYKINEDYFNKTKQQRLIELLKSVHKYTQKKATDFVNDMDINYDNIIEEKNSIQNELIAIKTSKGWKIMESIRKIINRR